VSECDSEASTMMRLCPTGGCCVMVKKSIKNYVSSYQKSVSTHDAETDSSLSLLITN